VKRLLLVALTGVIALAACGAQLPAAPTDLATVSQNVADLAPIIVKAAEPAPLMPLFPVQPPVTFGGPEQSWYEVTAFSVTRPDAGGPCTATAFEQPDHRVAVEPVSCSGASMAVVTVTELSGRGSHQFVGPQRLVITQRAQGVQVAQPTFTLTVEGRQIWPK